MTSQEASGPTGTPPTRDGGGIRGLGSTPRGGDPRRRPGCVRRHRCPVTGFERGTGRGGLDVHDEPDRHGRHEPRGDGLAAARQSLADHAASFRVHAGTRTTEADRREVRRAAPTGQRRIIDRGHPGGDVGGAAERGRRGQGLRRDQVHRRARQPVSGHERALPRRAHPVACIRPFLAGHRSGIGWPCLLVMDGDLRLRGARSGVRSWWAGVPGSRACCLQRVGPIDLRHRRAREMVATRSWRGDLLIRSGPAPSSRRSPGRRILEAS
jgi:hypothetical protein